jgi:hypothetical protein
MQKTVILSAETLRNLIEAHASMAAWYYELWRAHREGGPVVHPDEARRAAFVKNVAREFPELAALAASVEKPRLYVPQPVVELPKVVPASGGAED